MNSRVLNIILPIIAVIIYICIDFLYLFLTKNRYEAVVKNIQKDDMKIDAVAAVICYILLGLGWYFIAVNLALSYFDRLKQRSPAWTPIASSALSGLVAGVLFGLVVFGVFDLTMRALFSSRYPLWLLSQDIAWGALFNMVYTSVYMMLWRKLTSPVEL